MGKFNRPSRTRKLEALTAKIEGQPAAVTTTTKGPELQKQVKQIMKDKKTATPKPVQVPTPKPQPAPAPRVAEKPTENDAVITNTAEELAAMNVYRKIQLARRVIADFDMKKSGQNSDKGFTYFELPDYLPMINRLNEKIGLMTKFDMTNEKGTLKIFNIDKPEEVIEFELPTADLVMADAEGNKAEGIQVMGGKSTYMRRYLMQVAYEISVKDTVDSRGAKPAKPEDELDPRDVEAIKEASDLEHLNTICQNIRQRKGFNKNQALLKHYTEAKQKLA